jgi:hypothetical protein
MEAISEYLTTAAVAKVRGGSMRTLRQMCQKGKIPGAVKIGRDWFIPKASLEHVPPLRPPGRPPRQPPAPDAAPADAADDAGGGTKARRRKQP